MDCRMQRADSSEEMVIHHVLNGAKRIPAKNIHVVPLYDLIPEFFELDGGFSVTERPQWGLTFTANGNTGMFIFQSPCGGHDEITRDLQKALRIELVVDR